MTFRDKGMTSVVTGVKGTGVKVPWLYNMEDSEENYLQNGAEENDPNTSKYQH